MNNKMPAERGSCFPTPIYFTCRTLRGYSTTPTNKTFY